MFGLEGEAEVDGQGGGAPSSDEHDLHGDCGVGKEEGCGCPRADGVSAYFMGVVSKRVKAAAKLTGVTEEEAHVFLADISGWRGEIGGVEPTIERGGWGSVER
ncbi:hypothetical protein ACA910_013113 [Epithemia clementina (nom. ined.)]